MHWLQLHAVCWLQKAFEACRSRGCWVLADAYDAQVCCSDRMGQGQGNGVVVLPVNCGRVTDPDQATWKSATCTSTIGIAIHTQEQCSLCVLVCFHATPCGVHTVLTQNLVAGAVC
jgi:hypothetical protein